MHFYSQHGLVGMPPSLQYLREEVGLSGAPWESLGSIWQTLAAQWLRVEAALGTSGRTDLTYDEIRKSSIPDQWKDWMSAKLMKTDAQRPSESFGQGFTDYLRGLPLSTLKVRGTVMSEMWSCPGKTGVIGLLLCLYWQVEYSGSGKDWEGNVKRVESIFNAILAIPEL
jgi:hypothetical protein